MPIDLENIPWTILENESINQILSGILGSGYYLNSYTCNRNSAKYNQPIHMDCSHFHSKKVRMISGVGPPHELIVNIYLQDTNEMNGSLEIVPGSHMIADVELEEEGEVKEEYLNISTERLNFPRGSAIIRDKRTWHRGTKNLSTEPRFMVSLRFNSKWLQSRELRFDDRSRDKFLDLLPFSIDNLVFV